MDNKVTGFKKRDKVSTHLKQLNCNVELKHIFVQFKPYLIRYVDIPIKISMGTMENLNNLKRL